METGARPPGAEELAVERSDSGKVSMKPTTGPDSVSTRRLSDSVCDAMVGSAERENVNNSEGVMLDLLACECGIDMGSQKVTKSVWGVSATTPKQGKTGHGFPGCRGRDRAAGR